MKITLISLLSATMLLVFSICSSAQTTGEEAAIRQVLHASHLAFNKRELKVFSGYFIQSPTLYYQVTTADNHLYMARGWEAMTHMVGNHMKDDPQDFPADPTPIPSTDTHIHVNGNTAWVDETTHWEGDGKKWNGRDLLILEKKAAGWKISALTTQVYSEGNLVEIK